MTQPLHPTYITKRSEIEEWLYKHHIDRYEFTESLGVKVEGNVDLKDKNLTFLPIQFAIVSGHFDCSNNALLSLEGSPWSVGGDFKCMKNKLTTLEFAPTKVIGKFNCSHNLITSLKHAPRHVRGSFGCYDNQLTRLEFAPEYVGQNFHCGKNNIEDLSSFSVEMNDEYSLFCDTKIKELRDYFKENFPFYEEKGITSSSIRVKELKVLREKWNLFENTVSENKNLTKTLKNIKI